MKYIFLDCDGVLNGHESHDNGYTGTRPDCVARFNEIVRKSDARIVVSSAWRYTVLRGHSTLLGLENLFLTHGLDCHDRLVGITEPDHHAANRGELISRWIARHCFRDFRYIVLDDGGETPDGRVTDLGIEALHEDHFIQTNSKTGLTDTDVKVALFILNGDYPTLKY